MEAYCAGYGFVSWRNSCENLADNTGVPSLEPHLVLAELLALIPFLAAAFFPARFTGCAQPWPRWIQIAAPSFLAALYVLVAWSGGIFRWQWLAVYLLLPAAMAAVLLFVPRAGLYWTQLLILLGLGVAVDFGLFDSAWPPHLAVFNRFLLLDLAIYLFIALRPIEGAGFDLRLRPRDLAIGLREFVFCFPVGLLVGLAIGFLHLHPFSSGISVQQALLEVVRFGLGWVRIFFFIAVPEELFFRGWLQNLAERRLGRAPALLIVAALFGLSHFSHYNSLGVYFNWRYVLLAAIAGVFYGRAWRAERRVGAAAVTHATVDAVWSLWLR
jgi:uncharacterized protein